MNITFLALFKYSFILTYVCSISYIHLRGTVRLSLIKQLFDHSDLLGIIAIGDLRPVDRNALLVDLDVIGVAVFQLMEDVLQSIDQVLEQEDIVR